MAREFQGDPKKMRARSIDFVEHSLGLQTDDWPVEARAAFESLAILLAMTRLDRWKIGDKQLAVRIIHAKGSGDEALYLKLMQKHVPLRAEVIRMGS